MDILTPLYSNQNKTNKKNRFLLLSSRDATSTAVRESILSPTTTSPPSSPAADIMEIEGFTIDGDAGSLDLQPIAHSLASAAASATTAPGAATTESTPTPTIGPHSNEAAVLGETLLFDVLPAAHEAEHSPADLLLTGASLPLLNGNNNNGSNINDHHLYNNSNGNSGFEEHAGEAGEAGDGGRSSGGSSRAGSQDRGGSESGSVSDSRRSRGRRQRDDTRGRDVSRSIGRGTGRGASDRERSRDEGRVHSGGSSSSSLSPRCDRGTGGSGRGRGVSDSQKGGDGGSPRDEVEPSKVLHVRNVGYPVLQASLGYVFFRLVFVKIIHYY